ncbi:MAG: filamentous hemagglutinin N-terminal domain-containing protein [Cyanobacteria bacterium P01_A01_bin.123]
MLSHTHHQPILWVSRLGQVVASLSILSTAYPAVADSLVVPDDTLSAEGSVVTDIDTVTQQIEGGATRGANLFHSFLEFNVGEDQQVYFANPTGIDTILSRVTGGNPSEILGRLGVLGDADLFLANPNGIVFGEHASLDVNGSFYATTAEAIPLGDGVFSAVESQNSSLLTVRPDAMFENYLTGSSGDITSEARLVTGGNLALAAQNLQLQGQLLAGQDLTLLATDTVTVRDTATEAFVAEAGGNLTVQGNQLVDIFALNHPESGLFSGRDLVLRSDASIIGDAHFYANGNWRIEQLSGDLQAMLSPTDPIILAGGDVSFSNYTGASLHILAGGSVTLGSITINSTGPVETTINPSNNTRYNSVNPISDLASFELTEYRATYNADGTVRTVEPISVPIIIDGSSQATLDVRAGIDWSSLGGLVPNTSGTSSHINTVLLPSPSLVNNPLLTPPAQLTTTSNSGGADITVNGDIRITQASGLVLLTNQFMPNTSSGTISINGMTDVYSVISTVPSINGNGGDIRVHGRGDVIVGIQELITEGDHQLGAVGGDIFMSSQSGDITYSPLPYTISTSSSRTVRFESDIRIGSGSVFLSTNTGNISTNFFGISRVAPNPGSISFVTNSGDISIRNSSFSSGVDSRTDPDTGSFSINFVNEWAGGDISFSTNEGNVNTFLASFRSNSSSRGSVDARAAGDILFSTNRGALNFVGSDFDSTSSARFDPIDSGAGGDISFNSDAGNISLISSDLNSSSISALGNAGVAGDISLNAPIIQNTTSRLFAVSLGESGAGGNVVLRARDIISGLDIFTLSEGGPSGSVQIYGDDSLVVENTRLIASGQITIPDPDPNNFLDPNRTIDIDLTGLGQSGNAFLSSPGELTLDNVEIVSDANGSADGGNITIANTRLVTLNNSTLRTNTLGTGGAAGNIFVQNVGGLILRNNSAIVSDAAFSAGGGNIDIDTNFVITIPNENSDIIVNAVSGDGGRIDIDAIGIYGLTEQNGLSTAQLRANSSSDLSADSQFGRSGTVNLNSLIADPSQGLDTLEDGFINPEDLISTSCIARSNTTEGAFVVTGTDGLPLRPDDAAASNFPATTVQTIPTETAQPPTWQIGDPIVEPDGAYTVADGRIVLSRTCE